MSEEAGSQTTEPEVAAPVPEAPAVMEPSAGALLRAAREAGGVELSALAVALKVSVKKLEALEADRHDLLPDAVFVRALASSVCRALKIDPAPILRQLPQTTAPRLEYDEAGLNTPFRTPGDVSRVPFWDRLSRPMVLAALTVLLGTLVLIFFPSTEQRAELGAIVTGNGPATAVSQPLEATPAAIESAAPASPAPPVREAPAAAVPPALTRPAPVPVAAPAAARPAPAPAVAAAAPASSTEAPTARKKLASTGIIVFRTEGPSWVEVTDGRGAIQLSRLIEPGEVIGVSGPLPLSVTVGRADITQVQVRGKPFPLDGVTRQGVARFEVQ